MMIGKLVSHYEIIEKLGEGAMGVVYRAHDTRLDRHVALKFLPHHIASDENDKQRFIHEAKAASALDHPNICTIHEIDETPDHNLFIVMSYYEGETLKKRIEQGPLKTVEVIDLAIQIAKGLAKAHAHGIIHRDIKPANIIATADGTAKILDFGLAKLGGQTLLTKTGTTLGTAAYMSPEQAREETVDNRTDIWSLGVILYEMITGKRPFKTEYEQALVYSILNEEPKPVSIIRGDVPKELEKIIQKAMAKNPKERYQGVDEILTELDSLRRSFGPEIVISERRKKTTRAVFYATAVLILIVGIFVVLQLSTRNSEVIDSVAVLPFQNLSADPEQEYFSDGMTEALITELSKIKALRVISRTSIMHYKKTDKTLPEIARELHVKAVVEGSVQRVQDVVRINAQLVRAEPEEHLWAKPFTKSLANILELQSEVAQAIANEIKITVTPEEKKQLASSRLVNPEAHEAYLKGRFFINKFTEADIRKGMVYFEQAIVKDSSFASAYTGLAEAYDNLMSGGWMPAKEAIPKLKALALKALSVDKSMGEAYAFIGDVEFYDWKWKAAEENFKRAIELEPNYVTGHFYYSFFLLVMKRYDEALSEVQRALDLEPLSIGANSHLISILWNTQHYDRAMGRAKEMLNIDPNSSYTYFQLGQCYLAKKMYAEAIAHYQKASELGDFISLAPLAAAYVLSGNVIKAREILADPRTKNLPFSLLAIIYASLGERERGLELLEKAYEEREMALLIITASPRGFLPAVDSLLTDPRFQALMKKMGLEK